jgi:phospholipid/cholesterol/gamma-HCH transport system permease protein
MLIHEFGPSLTAMMLATRVGAGIAAEIGSMVVTEQIDALEMNNIDPIDYLIVPRFTASVVMTGVLAAIGVTAALAMGALTAYSSFHLNPSVFFDVSHVHPGDLITGVVKCIAYGAAIPVVAGFCGLDARGGSEGVGNATTRAVISSSFAVILLDFIISGIALATWQSGT